MKTLLLTWCLLAFAGAPSLAQVEQVWAARYHGPGHGTDFAKALAVDGAGNVYVTGSSAGANGFSDYATVKYDGAGNRLWVARYRGPGTGNDSANAMGVDTAGNAYVTGGSSGVSFDTSWRFVSVGGTAGTNSTLSLFFITPGDTYLDDLALVAESGPQAGVNLIANGDFESGFPGSNYVASGSYTNSEISTTVKHSGNASLHLQGSVQGDPSNRVYQVISPALTQGQTYVLSYWILPKTNTATSLVIQVDDSSIASDVSLKATAMTNLDYATVKYDANGNQLWVARYDGSAKGDDVATALALDAAGNLFVTGSSVGTNRFLGYATIKYDVDGNQLWVDRFPAYANVIASQPALALDGQGNLYFAGYSQISDVHAYAIVKYDASGNQLWVAHYHLDYLENGLVPPATALAVDESGNAYVTGSSYAGFSGLGYVTEKFDANGKRLWSTNYNGPGNGRGSARAVAVDSAGNVYVTGTSVGTNGAQDYATVKYDASGQQLWVARYTFAVAAAMALDGSGNVYVTGSYAGTSGVNYATVKYDANGKEVWAARYDGDGSGSDEATALAVDGVGNVYVTGTSDWSDYGTVKYAQQSPSALPTITKQPVSQRAEVGDKLTFTVTAIGVTLIHNQWYSNVFQWRFNDMPISRATNDTLVLLNVQTVQAGNYSVIITNVFGAVTSAVARLAVSSRVQPVWVARSGRYGTALGVDSADDVYVGGSGGAVKYDANGTALWSADDISVVAVKVDSTDNLFVTGTTGGLNGRYDYGTAKYDPSGKRLWFGRYDGPASGDDVPAALAVDSAGSAYVTGASPPLSDGQFVGNDYATVKYDGSGAQLWVARYNGPDNNNDFPTALAVDNAGYVYVTGKTDGPSAYYSSATIKYDPAGNQLWAARYGGAGNGDARGIAMAVDSVGNVYVTGDSLGTNGYYEYTTIRYGPDGNQVWVSHYKSALNSQDGAAALVLDGAGNIYVTGTTTIYGLYANYATVKYDPDGNQLWVRRYLTGGARAMAVDGSGNVYVTGNSYATVKYDGNGNELWEARYTGPQHGDVATAVAVDSAGNVYVTGYSYDYTSGTEYATVKYAQAAIAATRFDSVALSAMGELQSRLTGEAGQFYDIQISTDLINWTTLTTLVNTTGAVEFTDPITAGAAQRFYRAVKQ